MITGYKEKENRICVENENQVANELNIFFARFETTDFVQKRALELQTLNSENGHPITLQVEVRKELAMINPKKAPGPDKISGKCLRECSRELAPIVHYLFQQSVDTHTRCRAYGNRPVLFPFQKSLDHPRTMTIYLWPSPP